MIFESDSALDIRKEEHTDDHFLSMNDSTTIDGTLKFPGAQNDTTLILPTISKTY